MLSLYTFCVVICSFLIVFVFYLILIGVDKYIPQPSELVYQYFPGNNVITNSHRTEPFPSLLISLSSSVASPASLFFSVVVPAFNESERISVMLDECLLFCSSKRKENEKFSFEIIVVNDGSQDDTVAIVSKYARIHSSDVVRVLNFTKNYGKGCAVKRGVLCCRGEWILFADADGAAKFSEVDKLLNSATRCLTPSGEAVAIGSRAHLEETAIASRTWYRTLLMHLFHFVVKFVGGVYHIRDTQCGFKLFSRVAASRLFPLQNLYRFSFDVELLRLASVANIPITEVAVAWHEVDGSKVNFRSMAYMGFELVRLRLMHTLGLWHLPLSNKKTIKSLSGKAGKLFGGVSDMMQASFDNVSSTTVNLGGLNFKVRGVLGDGRYATVYRLECTEPRGGFNGDRFFAWKKINVPIERLAEARGEVDLQMACMAHGFESNVVRIFHHSETPTSGGQSVSISILMELCTGDNLHQVVFGRHGMTEEQIARVLLQILPVLNYLHTQEPSVTHRDLKLANVLQRGDGTWALADFGSCYAANPFVVSRDLVGQEQDRVDRLTTPDYRAPELWDIHVGSIISPASDIWAIGVMIYEMCFGLSPFTSKLSCVSGKYNIPSSPPLSALFRRLLSMCLVLDPKKRCSANDLYKLIAKIYEKTIVVTDTSSSPDSHQSQLNFPATSSDEVSSMTSNRIPSYFSQPQLIAFNETPQIPSWKNSNSVVDEFATDINIFSTGANQNFTGISKNINDKRSSDLDFDNFAKSFSTTAIQNNDLEWPQTEGSCQQPSQAGSFWTEFDSTENTNGKFAEQSSQILRTPSFPNPPENILCIDELLKPPFTENMFCADCGEKNPKWASLAIGVFICLRCAGHHRGLGAHITHVRSVSLDSWSPEQLAFMVNGGNAKASVLFEARLPPTFERPQGDDAAAMAEFIKMKYIDRLFVCRSGTMHSVTDDISDADDDGDGSSSKQIPINLISPMRNSRMNIVDKSYNFPPVSNSNEVTSQLEWTDNSSINRTDNNNQSYNSQQLQPVPNYRDSLPKRFFRRVAEMGRYTISTESYKWMLKATSMDRCAPKQKYVRKFIVSAWAKRSGSKIFSDWEFFPALQYRLEFDDPVIVFKAVVTLEKVCEQGPPEILEFAFRSDGFLSVLNDVRERWVRMRDVHPAYSVLIVELLSFISEKGKFHRQFPIFEGNYSTDLYLNSIDRNLRSKKKSDPSIIADALLGKIINNITITAVVDMLQRVQAVLCTVLNGGGFSGFNPDRDACIAGCLVPLCNEIAGLLSAGAFIVGHCVCRDIVDVKCPSVKSFRDFHAALAKLYTDALKIGETASSVDVKALAPIAPIFVKGRVPTKATLPDSFGGNASM